MALKPDTSYYTGLVMSICSAFVWQLEGPRRNLRYYEALSSFMFTMALFMLVMGVFSLAIVNYGVTLIFALITIQQVWDSEIEEKEVNIESSKDDTDETSEVIEECQSKEKPEEENHPKPEKTTDDKNNEKEETNNCTEDEKKETPDDCDVCSESRIYRVFKNLRDKFSFNNDV